MKRRLIDLYKALFVRRALFRLHQRLLNISLWGMGILNSENSRWSGEEHFLRSLARRIPAGPELVVFDVGAGDTFHAGFLARYAEGADVIECVRFATHAAALKIQRPPLIDPLPTREEVERALATS